MRLVKRIFNWVSGQITLDKRLTAAEAEQKAQGYSIVLEPARGEGAFFTYTEGERMLYVAAYFSVWNDVTIFTNSLEFWISPRREPLSEFEYKKVLNRVIKYASSWGNVSLSDAKLVQPEDVKRELAAQGIPFEELENGIITYTSTIENETKRKGGFFNR
jgi:hypothetical protein